jgi:hypothetical protein
LIVVVYIIGNWNWKNKKNYPSQHNTENKYMHITNLKRKGGSETWLPTLNLGTPLALFHLVSFLLKILWHAKVLHTSLLTHYFIFRPFIVMATFFVCVTFHLICIYFLPFICPLTFCWGFSFHKCNLSSLVPKKPI